MSHMWVDITQCSSANATLSGHVVFRLLWTGVPSMTKIWVAPESAIASFDAIVIVAYTHFDCCLGANKENANSRLVVNPFDTFDVTTVMSSLSTMNSLTGENNRAGSDVVLITENVSLHLNATLPTIAPNRHIWGKTVLWQLFVLHLYPALMYCCAFCRVK
jgi:hypothetical protein